MKISPEPVTITRGMSRRDRNLLLVLAGMIVVWLITWPLRARLNRETARIERATAQKLAAQREANRLTTEEAQARQAVEQKPQDFSARMALAGVLVGLRNYPQAIDTLRAAAVLDPRSAQPHTVLGEVFDSMNMPDLAVQELNLALKQDPTDARALTLLAYKYVSFGWNRQAKQLLERALQRLPNDVRLHISLALVNFQMANAAESEQQLLIARSLAPGDPAVLGPLIEVYRHAQRYTDALKVIDQATSTGVDKQFLQLERAQIYVEMQNAPGVLQITHQMLQANPNDVYALYMRAEAEKQLGQSDAAIRDLEQILPKDPSFEQTQLLLGQLYLQKGQTEKGTALVRAYNQRNTISQAISRYTLRVATNPNDAQAHLQLGKSYMQANRIALAIVEFKRVLELRQKDRDARTLLIQALRQAGRSQEASALTTTS